MYRPFVYSSAKYGRGHALRQQWLGDLPVVLLAFVPSSSLTVRDIGGLIALFVAFVCLYELGYYENDRYAALSEAAPTPPADRGARHRVGAQAWIWFFALSAIAAWLLRANVVESAAWVVFGLTVRALFFLYNRTGVQRRVLLYPLLQASKSFGFMIVFPVNATGVALLLAHALKRVIAYTIYRFGGRHRSFPMHGAGLLVFFLISAALMAGARDTAPLHTVQYWLIVGWSVLRGGKEIARGGGA